MIYVPSASLSAFRYTSSIHVSKISYPRRHACVSRSAPAQQVKGNREGGRVVSEGIPFFVGKDALFRFRRECLVTLLGDDVVNLGIQVRDVSNRENGKTACRSQQQDLHSKQKSSNTSESSAQACLWGISKTCHQDHFGTCQCRWTCMLHDNSEDGGPSCFLWSSLPSTLRFNHKRGNTSWWKFSHTKQFRGLP